MTCDDLVEFIKKHDGIRRHKHRIERQMRLRFQQI